jgi:hypothetical protein
MHNFVRCNFNASTRKKKERPRQQGRGSKREKREAPMGSGCSGQHKKNKAMMVQYLDEEMVRFSRERR